MCLPVLQQCRQARNSTDQNAKACLIGMMLASEGTSNATDINIQNTTTSTTTSTTDTSKQLTDREIVDNIKIFLFAGHDSTASTILWTLYLLAVYPEHIVPIRKEMELFGQRPTSGSEFYDFLKSGMPYLHNVLKEVLRLYPPAWAINRAPKKDLVLGGYTIPKGTSIMINTLRMHRREDLGWERPLEFIPERWNHEENHYSKASFTYLPFGGGPRTCVGQPLAEIEMLTVISSIVQTFDLVLIAGNDSKASCDIDYFAGATIRPKNISNLRLKLRTVNVISK